MTTQIKRRRGTATQHGSFTGAEAEITVNTTNESIHVHDGSTAGGFELARADGSNVSNFAVGGTLNVSGAFTSLGIDDNADATAITISSGENVGIGCVPSDIRSGFDTLQIGGNLTLNVDSTGSGAGVYMGNNVYRDATDNRWEYIVTDEATQYYQASDQHVWRYASSGSANSAITWSEAMRISASNVGIGTSSPQAELHVHDSQGHAKIRLSGGASNADTFEIYQGITGVTNGGLTIRDVEASSDRLVINSSGNVAIGTSTATGKLTVDGGFLQVQVGGTQAIRVGSTDHIVGGTDNDAVLQSNTGKNMRFLTGGSERMRISAGKLLLGVTSEIASSGALLHINAGSSGSLISETSLTSQVFHVHFRNGNGATGGIETSGTSTAYATSSDYRLKENVTADWNATTRLKQLNPIRFNFIADADKTVDGFLAHEVQAIVPEAITGTKDGVDADGNPEYQGIDQSKIVPLLTKTILELEARITALEGA